MLIPGLCSVTLRQLSQLDIVTIAADAGLTSIEWGGDIHVPPGDEATAERVRRVTEQAGLRVASYGSYLRLGESTTLEDIRLVVRTARVLGAPRLRVWAGAQSSGVVSDEDRHAVVESTRRLADQAAENGIEVAFEFHGGTLTDVPSSALALVRQVAHPSVALYWQPPNDTPDEEVLVGLDLVIDEVRAVHVFSWWPQTVRLPLTRRGDMWRAVFARLRHTGRSMDALLEFVPGDDPAMVKAEAEALRQLTNDPA